MKGRCSPSRQRQGLRAWWQRGAIVLGLALAAAAASAQEPALVLGAGAYAIVPRHATRTALLDVEYRTAPLLFWGIGGALGIEATPERTVYARAGFTRDFPFGERWNANITEAVGAYSAGKGKQLGSTIEFRSALDVSCRVRPDWRIGLAIGHLSNAGIATHNPGVETLTITIAWLRPQR